MGAKGTPYEGLSYKLSLRFPLDYPFKPPQVKFETPCFHPNVDQFGHICLDILQVFRKMTESRVLTYADCFMEEGINASLFVLLQDKWSSAYDCRTVLLSIQSLLGGECFVHNIGECFLHLFRLQILNFNLIETEPNVDSPLNSYAATLWSNEEGSTSLLSNPFSAIWIKSLYSYTENKVELIKLSISFWFYCLKNHLENHFVTETQTVLLILQLHYKTKLFTRL